MKILLLVFLLLGLTANALAMQVVCTKKGYIVGTNGKTYAQQIKEKNKHDVLRFNFGTLHITRHFKGKEFSRKLTEVKKNRYKEDYLLGIVIHNFNGEKTQLVSTPQTSTQKVLTYLYTCVDYYELDQGIKI